jgi:hypothetical protein
MPAPACGGEIRDIDRVVYPFASGTIDIGLDISWGAVCTAPPSITVTVEDTGVLPYPSPPPAASATCTASQIRLTPGHQGVDLGTAYMRDSGLPASMGALEACSCVSTSRSVASRFDAQG